MAPAFVVVGMGVNATQALVVSQVILSIALPLPMIALLIFTGRRTVMGAFVNTRLTKAATVAATVLVIVLNAILIAQTFGLSMPGIPG
jgi:manganese transport protein